MGESSAEGVPLQQWLSIDRNVAWQLGQVIPERPIKVNSLATSGETLEQQHGRLVKLERRPEIVIIYCGHNEFKVRFSPMITPEYYIADRLPSTIQALIECIERIERSSPLCGLIAESAEKCRISIPPSLVETRDLIDVPVYSADEYATLLSDFKRRFEAMVSYAERVGAIPVLILPPANDAGDAPSRSFLPPSTPRADRAAFESEFLAATRREEQEPAASIQRLRELLKSQPEFAETHYRLARLLERAGSHEEAFSITSPPVTRTATRCAARRRFRMPIARWPCATAARSLTGRRISAESANVVSSATIFSRTSCTRRYEVRSRWHRLFCVAKNQGSLGLAQGFASRADRSGRLRRPLRARRENLGTPLLLGKDIQRAGSPAPVRSKSASAKENSGHDGGGATQTGNGARVDRLAKCWDTRGRSHGVLRSRRSGRAGAVIGDAAGDDEVTRTA